MSSSSSSQPESGVENQSEASSESGHGKEAEAESGQGKEAEEVILKPVKPEAAEREVEGAIIVIKVSSLTTPDIFYRVKRSYFMQRVMDHCCGKHSLDPRAVVFFNEEGKQIRAAQMAEEAGLEGGSTIHVVRTQ